MLPQSKSSQIKEIFEIFLPVVNRPEITIKICLWPMEANLTILSLTLYYLQSTYNQPNQFQMKLKLEFNS